MSDETKAELEAVANKLDEIADGLGTTNMLRARQLRDCVKRIVRIARNVPLERQQPGQYDGAKA